MHAYIHVYACSPAALSRRRQIAPLSLLSMTTTMRNPRLRNMLTRNSFLGIPKNLSLSLPEFLWNGRTGKLEREKKQGRMMSMPADTAAFCVLVKGRLRLKPWIAPRQKPEYDMWNSKKRLKWKVLFRGLSISSSSEDAKVGAKARLKKPLGFGWL